MTGGEEEQQPLWAMWPQLRKLALYDVYVDEDFAEAAKSLPLLDTLVLTCGVGLQTHPFPQMFRKDNEAQKLRILIVHEKNILDVEIKFAENYTDSEGTPRLVPDVQQFKGTVEIV